MNTKRRTGLVWLLSLAACTLGAFSIYQVQAREARAPVAQWPSAISGDREPERPGLDRPWLDRVVPTDPSGVGSVRLSAAVDRRAVLRSGDGRMYVEINVETPSQPSGGPPPASDILVVADVSGSMQGRKLHYAKQAIRELTSRLLPRDRLAIVDYADEARLRLPLTHASESARLSFLRLASSLETRGSTNLSGGLDLGLDVIESGRRPRRVSRMLLLSDGLANRGDTTREGLRRRARRASLGGYSLSTMGIGSDFDEGVMTALASAGTGAFYYLNRLEALSEFFDAELKNARQTYAHACQLELRLSPGIEVESVMGLPVERRGDRVTAALGSLYAGQTRRVWVTLRVPTSGAPEQALGDVSLRYERDGREQGSAVRPLPRVRRVDRFEDFQAAIDGDVWERAVLEEELNAAQERFGDAVRSGSARDLTRALERAQSKRRVATALGKKKVLGALDSLEDDAEQARREQQAPAAVRSRAAKKRKAMGFGERNKAAYPNADYDLGF